MTKGKLMTQDQSPEERLQREFNRWADDGEGAKMERHHLDITEKTLRRMDLRSGERVLDLGCGSGWATRLLARAVCSVSKDVGQVVGVDVSDEMIRLARVASKDFDNVTFAVGSAAQIPCEEKLVGQGAVSGIVLLLSGSRSGAGRVVSCYGTARPAIYSN